MGFYNNFIISNMKLNYGPNVHLPLYLRVNRKGQDLSAAVLLTPTGRFSHIIIL